MNAQKIRPVISLLCRILGTASLICCTSLASHVHAAPAQMADMETLNQQNQEYLGQLTILDGRMMAVMNLYRAGKVDDARIQAQMAVSMSQDLASTITDHGSEDNTAMLQTIKDMLDKGTDIDAMGEHYAEWRNALLGTRFQTPYSLGTQLRSIATALKKASGLYESSVALDGGKIEHIADYQTAFGIVQAARQVLQLYIGETTTDDQRHVFDNISDDLNGLGILMPDANPAPNTPIDAEGFADTVDRIAMKALTLR